VRVETLVHGVRRDLGEVIERRQPQQPPEDVVRTTGSRASGWEVTAEAVGCLVAADLDRSAAQEMRFAEQQVVEPAVRALPPGTNDPYTAVNAIEELAARIRAISPPSTITQQPGAPVRLLMTITDDRPRVPPEHIPALCQHPVSWRARSCPLRSLLGRQGNGGLGGITAGSATGVICSSAAVLARVGQPHPDLLECFLKGEVIEPWFCGRCRGGCGGWGVRG
jgi:hypothetical protein